MNNRSYFFSYIFSASVPLILRIGLGDNQFLAGRQYNQESILAFYIVMPGKTELVDSCIEVLEL